MRLMERISSPRLLPVLLLAGVAVYALVAAVQEEALVLLLGLVRRSLTLQLLLWLLPVSQLVRMYGCLRDWRQRRAGVLPLAVGCGGETVRLAGRLMADTGSQLAAAGYRVRSGGGELYAWRGISNLPLRALGCLAVACLSGGLIVSIAGREVRRVALIPGEPLPPFIGGQGVVAAVAVQETPADRIFARRLTVQVRQEDGSARSLPMFPASRLGGWWYYPRFIGRAPLFTFAAEAPPVRVEDYHLLAIYPEGREDTASIAGTPYRIVARLAEASDGEPGKEALQLRVMRDDTLLVGGTVAVGGRLSFAGGSLSVAEMRQFVMADFVRDAGLPCIWFGLGCGGAALGGGVLLRLFAPRREIRVQEAGDGHLICWSLAEGGQRAHAQQVHGILDQISLC